MDDERRAAPAAGGESEIAAPADEPERQPGLIARFLGLGDERGDAPVNDQSATPSERALYSNIRTMRDQRVDDIMIPRVDIVAVAEDASLEDLTEAFRVGAHSRLPVYRETLDDPLGFIHVKDVALARGLGANGDAPFVMSDWIGSVDVKDHI